MSTVTHIINHATYLRVAVGFVLLAMLALFMVPDPLTIFVVAAIPLVFVAAYYLKDFPFELCLAFIIFSFFRIHEAFVFLMPFHIPQLLAIVTLLSLIWHYFGTRQIQPYWTPELKIFVWFFALCTIGLFFATDRPAAFKYWSDSFVKIAIMVLATSWLTRETRHLNRLSISIVLAGIGISLVTLYNKTNGIGLVEETRVTIGRDFGSVLGDPNDLSMVLLFPMSFACSLLLTRGLARWQRLLGLIGMPLILSAIIATQSRGGLLGIAVVFGIFGRYKIKSNVTLIIIAASALMLLFAAAGHFRPVLGRGGGSGNRRIGRWPSLCLGSGIQDGPVASADRGGT